MAVSSLRSGTTFLAEERKTITATYRHEELGPELGKRKKVRCVTFMISYPKIPPSQIPQRNPRKRVFPSQSHTQIYVLSLA